VHNLESIQEIWTMGFNCCRQGCGKIVIDLYCDHPLSMWQKCQRQTSEARTYLQDDIVRREFGGTSYASNRVRINHEILPTLFRWANLKALGKQANLRGTEKSV